MEGSSSQGHRRFALSVGARLALIQLLVLAAIGVVGVVAWHASDAGFVAAERVALISRAQQHHQHGDMMHDALRADVNAALLPADERSTTPEAVTKAVAADSRLYREDLAALALIPLPANVAQRAATAGEKAKNYIALAGEIVTLTRENRPEALTLEPVFRKTFDELAGLNTELTSALSNHVKLAGDQAHHALIVAQRWIAVAALGTALIACIFLAFIGGSLRRSLKKVRDVARALADGNLSVRNEIVRHDEVGSLARAVNEMADELQSMIDRLRSEADRNAFSAKLVEALEMADHETDVHHVVSRAMALIAPDMPMELLLSDSSRSHLERATLHPTAGAPGCTVESPFNCLAVRRSSTAVFDDSETLNACPKLRGRPGGPISAVCVPLSFMGRSLGVLHATAQHRELPSPDKIGQLTTLGMQSGARIGTVRAFERTQLQAQTDSLTGLSNRRTLEQALRDLTRNDTPYAFALADLDYFKRLNDSFGHEAGDKALRIFSDVLKRTVRAADQVARWGGEEFAVVFPRSSAFEAFEVIERIRLELAKAVASNGPPFTASFGVADSAMGSTFPEILRIADDALYRAKDGGRDRTTLGDPRHAPPPSARHDIEHDSTINVEMMALGLD